MVTDAEYDPDVDVETSPEEQRLHTIDYITHQLREAIAANDVGDAAKFRYRLAQIQANLGQYNLTIDDANGRS